MNVLMITGDRQLLVEGSNAWQRLQLQRSAVSELTVVYWGYGALTSAFRIRGKFDVVTAQDPFWRGLVAWFVARKLGAKVNIQVHADLSATSLVKHILAQMVLRHADTVRVVSARLKEQVLHSCPRAMVQVLPVFVDIERFRTVMRGASAHHRILWTGRFEEEKNPLAAIEVLREVLKEIPNAQLTMLGSGTLGSRLTSAAAGLPVVFPGWQDPLPFLASADVVLSTSWHESWGSSILEALAAQVPVVAPDVGIAREAGAVVVERERLAAAVIATLRTPQPAALKLALLPEDAWMSAWKESLI